MTTQLSTTQLSTRLNDIVDIHRISNFLNEHECNQLIKDAENYGYERSKVDAKVSKGKTESRTSSTSFIPESKTPTGKQILNKIKKYIPIDYAESTRIQVQKYTQTQQYNPHYDTFEQKDGKDQRNWTFMIYLNNVEEGGHTYFPKINLRVKPKKGTAVFWNNLDKDGCRHPATLHMGESVTKGVKYICTIWFRKKEYDICNKQDSFLLKPKEEWPNIKNTEYFTKKQDTLFESNTIPIFFLIVFFIFIATFTVYIVFRNKKSLFS